mgnify:CR=1 FL=1
MPGKRGSGVKNRGNRVAVNASGPQQQNVRGSGAKNKSVVVAEDPGPKPTPAPSTKEPRSTKGKTSSTR